ncbi:helix-turn-helix domain-containing protein [Deinococcus hopiensis]|uniref:helix-turn-helix domain-containing protein n=1 Tax=Deinococcus hopiensis TaxID=309885 RepID=UPI000A029980
MATPAALHALGPHPTSPHPAAQGQAFLSLAGSLRFVFSWALARRKAHYAETQKTLSLQDLRAERTGLKKQEETARLKASDSPLLQSALQDCDRAVKNFFEKRGGSPGSGQTPGYPRFPHPRAGTGRREAPVRAEVWVGQVPQAGGGWALVRLAVRDA